MNFDGFLAVLFLIGLAIPYLVGLIGAIQIIVSGHILFGIFLIGLWISTLAAFLIKMRDETIL